MISRLLFLISNETELQTLLLLLIIHIHIHTLRHSYLNEMCR